MPTTLKNEAALIGIGQTDFSKNSGRSELSLACEAVSAAIDDAGLQPSEIDGLVTFALDQNDEIEIARAVGIGGLNLFSRIPYGGGAAVSVIHQAAMAIATGSCKNVICYRALNGRSGQRYSAGVSGDLVTSDLIHWSWYMPFGSDDTSQLGGHVHHAVHARVGLHLSRDLAEVCMVSTAGARGEESPTPSSTSGRMTFEDHQNVPSDRRIRCGSTTAARRRMAVPRAWS